MTTQTKMFYARYEQEERGCMYSLTSGPHVTADQAEDAFNNAWAKSQRNARAFWNVILPDVTPVILETLDA